MTFTLDIDGNNVIGKPTLVPPPAEGHKYNRGHALVCSGPPLRTGASRLSAQAALAVGAGLVTIIGEKAALAEHAAHVTAIMLRARESEWAEIDERVTALAIGPGYGTDEQCRMDVKVLAGTRKPLVIDADGLTAFEGQRERLFSALHSSVILTPHQGEFTRMFPSIPTGKPVAAAIAAAKQSNAIVLLKGAESIVAAADGRFAINRHANSWLSTAGSGDVLTGLICGIMAQGETPFDAACIAAWLHGDIAIRHGAGLTADRMIDQIPLVLQGCLAD